MKLSKAERTDLAGLLNRLVEMDRQDAEERMAQFNGEDVNDASSLETKMSQVMSNMGSVMNNDEIPPEAVKFTISEQ